MANFITKFLVAAALVAGTSAAMLTAASPAFAQGYVYYPSSPTYVTPGYAYAPGYAAPVYGYAPGYGYGSFDESGNSVRQPSPSSTIRAVR